VRLSDGHVWLMQPVMHTISRGFQAVSTGGLEVLRHSRRLRTAYCVFTVVLLSYGCCSRHILHCMCLVITFSRLNCIVVFVALWYYCSNPDMQCGSVGHF